MGKSTVFDYLVLHIGYLEVVAVRVVGVPEKGRWCYALISAALVELLVQLGDEYVRQATTEKDE